MSAAPVLRKSQAQCPEYEGEDDDSDGRPIGAFDLPRDCRLLDSQLLQLQLPHLVHLCACRTHVGKCNK